MRKIIKFLAGILLIPLCHAVTLAFTRQLNTHNDWNNLELTTYWFFGGFVLWILLFILLPRPFLTYVLAHELTHALWGLLMGARVSRLKVSSKGGSVTLTRTNFLITLAPYFFPFYSVVALMVFLLIQWQWDMSVYLPFWYALLGLTWAFHLTFTVHMLGIHQPDIQEHGRLFSYTVIYLINLSTAALLLNLFTKRDLSSFLTFFWQNISSTYFIYWEWILTGITIWKAKWPY